MGSQGSAQANFAKIGADIALFNTGLMKGMMINPNVIDDACNESLTNANTYLSAMFDIDTYTSTGTFDFFEFIDTLSIMNLYLIDQQEKCGFDKYMERMDNMFSHWDAFGGAMAAGVTDIVVNYADTSRVDDNFDRYLAPTIEAWENQIIPAFSVTWSDIDWSQVGYGFMLFASSLVKFEQGQGVFGVEPITI
jgi:hypothetical protein